MGIVEAGVVGKVAIVTGATRGIGQAIALAYAKAGIKVAVVSRSAVDCEQAAQAIRETGGEAMAAPCDVTQIEEFRLLVARVVERWGKLDIMMNNAGTAITRKAIDLSEEEWDRVLDLDLKSVFFCAQAAARVMIPHKSGKIINIASILGLVGGNGLVSYCAAKGGVVNLTRALANEWARYGIQVNCICPGYVITDINRDYLGNEKAQAPLLAKTPAGRLGQVGDMTGAALFLASSAADYMTGQALTVDGGWTAI
jgi:NAD(P)-dependent dehydrogenase (short-subunit alcohol dehydrogenase family)